MATRGLSLSVSGAEAAPPRCRPPVSAMTWELKMKQEGSSLWMDILIFFKQDTFVQVLDAYLLWMTLVHVTDCTRLDAEVTKLLCMVVAEYVDYGTNLAHMKVR